MKKIFKKNQIIITALAVMIAAAGYISYSDAQIKGKKDKTAKTETASETVRRPPATVQMPRLPAKSHPAQNHRLRRHRGRLF